MDPVEKELSRMRAEVVRWMRLMIALELLIGGVVVSLFLYASAWRFFDRM